MFVLWTQDCHCTWIYPSPSKGPEIIQAQYRVGVVCYNGRGRRCRRDNFFDRCFMIPQLSHVVFTGDKGFPDCL